MLLLLPVRGSKKLPVIGQKKDWGAKTLPLPPGLLRRVVLKVREIPKPVANTPRNDKWGCAGGVSW